MASYGYLYKRKPRPAAISGSDDTLAICLPALDRRKPSLRPAAISGSEDSLASYLARRKHSTRPAAVSGSEESFSSYVYLDRIKPRTAPWKVMFTWIELIPNQQLFLIPRIVLKVLVTWIG